MLRIAPIGKFSLLKQQRRHYVFSAVAALASLAFSRDVRLADQIEDLEDKKPSLLNQQLQTNHQVVSNRYPDGRYKLTAVERTILLVVSGLGATFNPQVGYHINNFGEVTSFEFILKALRDRMLATAEGRQLLRERPLMNPSTLDPEWLKTLPKNTLGYQYYEFTKSGDERAPVRFIDDEELAYVFLRYRQIHDIVHILTGSKIDLAGELPVKAFEFGNTGLPMTGLACLIYFKLSDKRKNHVHMVDSFINGLQATSLITVYWEKYMERDLNDLRKQLGVLTH